MRSYSYLGVLLLLLTGCRPTPVLQPQTLRLSQINIVGLEQPANSRSVTFDYDMDGKLIRYTHQSAEGISLYGGALTYNAQGQLSRVDWFGQRPEGIINGYETYSYLNNVLQAVTIYENGSLSYQYRIKVDQAGRISAIQGVGFKDAPRLAPCQIRYVISEGGIYERLEVIKELGTVYQLLFDKPDSTISSPYKSWKGVPFDVSQPFQQYVNAPPLVFWAANSKMSYTMAIEFKGNYAMMKPIYERSISRKLNAEKLPIEEIYSTSNLDGNTSVVRYLYKYKSVY